jgi:two-component system, OmpR family, phosphate regulon response regulator PhoB
VNAKAALPRVLIVEDEPDLVRIVEFNLQSAGFETHTVLRASEVLQAVQTVRPDIILLDLMLPDGSGMDVCRALKSAPATKHIPVVMVTARGEEIDRVVGFEIGADDYVVKPFSVRELILRVRAILRRIELEQSGAPSDDVVTFGVLKVDHTAHRVYVENVEIVLTALEFRLLTTLIERRNRVQSRDTLLSDVWGIHVHVETRTVDTHVKRLREKLGAAGEYVHTVRGVGYRFASNPEDQG